ncbi:hypothetical protein [Solimonas marina]|uniref:Uncharacterized protein n=1 Tax=Solimonas marina TaxID=2714601 RepID=A0A970BBG8_9GAMM|nr:hypothetical protein [Solimonas marina]NKF24411.1 hypothetical protein [Solimonas marina]
MGTLNISRSEQDALQAIDIHQLDKLIEQSMREQHALALRNQRLESCGDFVYAQFRHFESDLGAYRAAKSSKKVSETELDAQRAGQNLADAVRQMKYLLEKELRERERFYIDDLILPPHHFDKRLRVAVRYRWRPTTDGNWQSGSITFAYDVDLSPDYRFPQRAPKRKPSVAQQQRDEQDKLARTWEHLRQQALHSLRQFFREGGDGAKVPDRFQVRLDASGRYLNNYSAQFWSEPS